MAEDQDERTQAVTHMDTMTWQTHVSELLGQLVAGQKGMSERIASLDEKQAKQNGNVARVTADLAKHEPCAALLLRVGALETANTAAMQSRRDVKDATKNWWATAERLLWFLAGSILYLILSNGPQIAKFLKP